MKQLFHFTLFSLFFTFLSSQEQISDVEFLVQDDLHSRKIFIQVDGDDYFVEGGVHEVKVSRIVGDSLELQYIIDDRPTDSNPNYYAAGSMYYSNLIYENGLLYELYWDYIYVFDFATGKLDHIVNLKQTGISLQAYFRIIHGRYYFRGISDSLSGYFEYNPDNNQLLHIEFDDNAPAFSLRDKMYKISGDSSSILVYDLLSRQEDTLFVSEEHLISIERNAIEGSNGMLIKTKSGYKTYYINRENQHQEISCLANRSYVVGAVGPEHVYVVEESENGWYDFKVIDRETCIELDNHRLPMDTPYDKLYFHDTEALDWKYVLLAYDSDWQGTGGQFIYDVNEESFHTMDIVADRLLLESAVNHEGYFYFLSTDEIHYIGNTIELHRINLETKEVNRLDTFERTSVHNIVMSKPRAEGHRFHVFYKTAEINALMRYDGQTNQLEIIQEFDYNVNKGLYSGLHKKAWIGDDLLFTSSSGIYLLSDNEVEELIRIPFTYTYYLEVDGQYVYALVYANSIAYHIKMKISDFEFTINEWPELQPYHNNPAGHLVMCSKSSYYVNGYLNMKTGKFKPFVFQGDTLRPFRIEVSGNKILIDTGINGYYLFDIKTELISRPEISDNEHVKPIPDGGGGFYLTPWKYLKEWAHFAYLNGDGSIKIIKEDFNEPVFYGGRSNMDGITSILFDTQDTMLIYMGSKDQHMFFNIPDNGIEYWSTFNYKWVVNGHTHILEIYNGESYDIYLIEYPKAPIRINQTGRTERLVDVLFSDKKLTFISQDKQDYTLIFEDYHLVSGSWKEMTRLNSVKNWFYGGSYLALNANDYLISLNDGIHGLEPWIYNSLTGDLRLLKDINDGFLGSNIFDLTMDPGGKDCYFVATNSEFERQLFHLELETLQTNTIDVVTPHDKIKIYPSPSVGTIRVDKDVDNARIYNAHGELIKVLNELKAHQPIYLESLPAGIYYLVSNDGASFSPFIIAE